MLLLHGLAGTPEDWNPVLTGLRAFCRPTPVPLPLADGPADVVGVAALTERVAGMLESAPGVLCGSSLGGHLALRVAHAFPERVRGLILCGASGVEEAPEPALLPRRPDRAFVAAQMRRIFHDPAHVTEDAITERLALIATPERVARLIRIARAFRQDDLRARLPEITAPTLLLWGDQDQITPPSAARTLAAALPDARLVLLPDCGHAPMIERPDAFVAATAAFVRALA